MIFGIDIGTTSVAGVAVDKDGAVTARVTRAHQADVPALHEGFHEQDPRKLKSAADCVVRELSEKAGSAEQIGWTGQMHGVVGTDGDLRPMTNFVTWRDRRRYGGRVMTDWFAAGLRPAHCLPVCAFCAGRIAIDETFLHSWYLDEGKVDFPREWLPQIVEWSMLGDNQAGVYAAQRLHPGCAVVNLGTSGQLSIVRETPFAGSAIPGTEAADGSRCEYRPYPDGRTLECRASLLGGAAWAALKDRLGCSWEAMNATDDPTVRDCARKIADDLFRDVDLSGVTNLVGIGNALALNPALQKAVEERSDLVCRIPACPEMAAYGAALRVIDRFAN